MLFPKYHTSEIVYNLLNVTVGIYNLLNVTVGIVNGRICREMLKPWAILALTTLAVTSATSDDKWTYYKGEYTNKERRCSRGTCELGPHAYRGTQFQGPAWSVNIFFEDPQLIIESPWYNRIRRDAQKYGDGDLKQAQKYGDGDPVRLEDILHEEMTIRYTRNANDPFYLDDHGGAGSERLITLPANEHTEGYR